MTKARNINNLGGRVQVAVEGAGLERFLNRANGAGVRLEHVVRDKSSVTCWVSMDDFYRLPALLRPLHLSMRILSKRGFPVLRLALRQRRGFAVGCLLAILLFAVAITRIWTIDVVAPEGFSAQALHEAIEQYGATVGMYKGDIDCEAIEEALRAAYPQISWASVSISGVRLNVQVALSAPPPEIYDRAEACDIVAAKDGVIESILALEGEALVKPGDVVQRGQVLIRGVEKALAATPRPDTPNIGWNAAVHARGVIEARVTYTASTRVSLLEVDRQPTGRVARRRTLSILGWEIPLPGDAPFAEYDERAEQHYLLGNLFLPVSVDTLTLSEVTVTTRPRDPNAVRAEGRDLSLHMAYEKCPLHAHVIDKRVEFSMIQGDALLTTAYLETLERIGVEKRP